VEQADTDLLHEGNHFCTMKGFQSGSGPKERSIQPGSTCCVAYFLTSALIVLRLKFIEETIFKTCPIAVPIIPRPAQIWD
jgi:hypothetical protein